MQPDDDATGPLPADPAPERGASDDGGALDLEALAAEAADPGTTPDRMFELSTLHPDLLPALASNPQLYTGLREWLMDMQDPRIDDALALASARAAAGAGPAGPVTPTGTDRVVATSSVGARAAEERAGDRPAAQPTAERPADRSTADRPTVEGRTVHAARTGEAPRTPGTAPHRRTIVPGRGSSAAPSATPPVGAGTAAAASASTPVPTASAAADPPPTYPPRSRDAQSRRPQSQHTKSQHPQSQRSVSPQGDPAAAAASTPAGTSAPAGAATPTARSAPAAASDGTAAPRRRRVWPWIVAALILVAVGIAGYQLGIGSRDSAAPAPAVPPAPGPAVPPADAPAAPDGTHASQDAEPADGDVEPDPTGQLTDDEALELLEERRDISAAELSLDDRWVVQLASKHPGEVDPYEFTERGTHTFYARDIWAQHLQIEAGVADHDATVLLLNAEDFGRQRDREATYWITLVDPGYLETEEEADAYCAELFPELTGHQLDNSCLSRRLEEPYR